jgi:hypothetical protein
MHGIRCAFRETDPGYGSVVRVGWVAQEARVVPVHGHADRFQAAVAVVVTNEGTATQKNTRQDKTRQDQIRLDEMLV